MPTSTRLFPSLALLLTAIVAPACTAFSGAADDSAPVPPRGDEGKTPAVTGTPDQSEINERLGFFVAPNGRADNVGSREKPLDSIQAAIALGKEAGKRVYVCSGTYHEALTLADSVAVIGGLDCTAGDWKFGAVRSRIEAPSSPAVRGKNITSITRLEGLEIVAPNAKDPSGSSIGLFADHSKGIVIAGSKITAGDGANGADGTEGTQLTLDAAAANGASTLVEAECVLNSTCSMQPVPALLPWMKHAGAAGGRSICSGAPGHDGQTGGAGGSGGLWVSVKYAGQPASVWIYYGDKVAFAPEYGEDRPRGAAAAGANGTASALLGALTPDGYAAANGVAGTDGAPGNGGFGGRGSSPATSANTVSASAVWRGAGGPGGGAGGCPGLAGAPGGGGGASIALALVDSPVTIDSTQLLAGKGGAGGHGTFGSDPTSGGQPGANNGIDPNAYARGGGNGGVPGVSTNGSNGPSVGVMHSGGAPVLRGESKVTPGQAVPAIEARSRTDALGNTRTIPEAPAGITKDVLAL